MTNLDKDRECISLLKGEAKLKSPRSTNLRSICANSLSRLKPLSTGKASDKVFFWKPTGKVTNQLKVVEISPEI